MIRLLILTGLIYVAWRLFKAFLPGSGGTRRPIQRPGDGGVDVMVQDPVCGVYFPKREGVSLNSGSGDIWFCSNKCKNKYLNDNLKRNA